MCLLTEAGHEVVCVYLTRGEAGIAGMSHSEAAAVRVVESENACKVTGARHIFMNQVDGNTEVNLERYKEMRELIDRENPDIVMTHWPLDAIVWVCFNSELDCTAFSKGNDLIKRVAAIQPDATTYLGIPVGRRSIVLDRL